MRSIEFHQPIDVVIRTRCTFCLRAEQGQSPDVMLLAVLGQCRCVNVQAFVRISIGRNGFVINGIDVNDNSGRSVSGAGDINDDGVDDLILGAKDADPNGNSLAGESYVVFGSAYAPVEVDLVSSCLAGLGRVDLNIVNTRTASSVYRFELQGLSARQTNVAFEDWGRMPITYRAPATYSAVVKRDGETILSESIPINCAASTPPVSTPEVTIQNACRASNGYVLFQMVNPTATTRLPF